MNRGYNISMEISGKTAMWTRPDTGDSPVSYPVPTYSAAKGIFEAILRLETVEIVPKIVEICAPIIYHNYSTNYGGPLRKSAIMSTGDSFQLIATVLINVCYRLYAELRLNEGMDKTTRDIHFNDLHAWHDIFNRRLERSQCHDIPFLGWREFVPDYFGPFRETTRVEESINLLLPSFLRSVFEPSGQKNPVFDHDSKIINGRLAYVERTERSCP
jgi:CRISPR-associated protein Cas5d